MKKSRFSEKQIVAILNKAQQGVKIVDLCREHGISDATFYNWRSKYGGLSGSCPICDLFKKDVPLH